MFQWPWRIHHHSNTTSRWWQLRTRVTTVLCNLWAWVRTEINIIQERTTTQCIPGLRFLPLLSSSNDYTGGDLYYLLGYFITEFDNQTLHLPVDDHTIQVSVPPLLLFYSRARSTASILTANSLRWRLDRSFHYCNDLSAISTLSDCIRSPCWTKSEWWSRPSTSMKWRRRGTSGTKGIFHIPFRFVLEK